MNHKLVRSAMMTLAGVACLGLVGCGPEGPAPASGPGAQSGFFSLSEGDQQGVCKRAADSGNPGRFLARKFPSDSASSIESLCNKHGISLGRAG